MYVYMYILNVIVIGFTQFYHPSILVLLTAILTMVGAIFSKMQKKFQIQLQNHDLLVFCHIETRIYIMLYILLTP